MAGSMTPAARAIVAKIATRDPALAQKINADVTAGDRDQFIKDQDTAGVKKYITPREEQTLLNGTTFDGKPSAGGGWTAGPEAAGKAAAHAFTNPLSALFQANIWIRVGEVALGIVLIAVGLARITNAIPIATKIAGKIK